MAALHKSDDNLFKGGNERNLPAGTSNNSIECEHTADMEAKPRDRTPIAIQFRSNSI
jgi:hypothetical protein